MYYETTLEDVYLKVFIAACCLLQGNGDGSFVEVYSGTQKQHKLTRLSPSTSYALRLAAVNSVGQRLANISSHM